MCWPSAPSQCQQFSRLHTWEFSQCHHNTLQYFDPKERQCWAKRGALARQFFLSSTQCDIYCFMPLPKASSVGQDDEIFMWLFFFTKITVGSTLDPLQTRGLAFHKQLNHFSAMSYHWLYHHNHHWLNKQSRYLFFHSRQLPSSSSSSSSLR